MAGAQGTFHPSTRYPVPSHEFYYKRKYSTVVLNFSLSFTNTNHDRILRLFLVGGEGCLRYTVPTGTEILIMHLGERWGILKVEGKRKLFRVSRNPEYHFLAFAKT